MPVSSPLKVCVLGLALDDWLGDGSRYTPTLPDLADWLVKHVDGPILDTGCGSGELLRLLMDRGINRSRLYGCDIESDHAQLACRRTGLSRRRIVAASLVDGNPFPGIQFQAVTAINWLQSDWPAEYAVASPRVSQNGRRLEDTLAAVKAALLPDGVFCWDWHGETLGADLVEKMKANSWRLRGRLDFPPDTKRYSENYPIWLFRSVSEAP